MMHILNCYIIDQLNSKLTFLQHHLHLCQIIVYCVCIINNKCNILLNIGLFHIAVAKSVKTKVSLTSNLLYVVNNTPW